jgi:hypothetical protein
MNQQSIYTEELFILSVAYPSELIKDIARSFCREIFRHTLCTKSCQAVILPFSHKKM